MRWARAHWAALVVLGGAGSAAADPPVRNIAGSVQLDYLAIPGAAAPRDIALDAATVELSLKMVMEFGDDMTSSVKVCVACHGLEVGMAFFDLRVADQLNFRLGRFTPAFGDFPLRHDPANHRTSDKPLPYDMGRMLRLREFNMSVLPAPWVDNGIEINGTHFFGGGDHQVDYAVYAVGGPRASAGAVDFDFTQSRTPSLYYVDNNSEPSVGGRLAASFGLGEELALSLGGSAMAGHYDPDRRLEFLVLGGDLVLQLDRLFWRTEYVIRRTAMEMGDDPSERFRYGPDALGHYDDFFVKEGFYTELELLLGRVELVARWDGLRRRGNVPAGSSLRSDSAVLRYTGAAAIRLHQTLRLKLSVEQYDFSDFTDELAIHVGVAGPF